MLLLFYVSKTFECCLLLEYIVVQHASTYVAEGSDKLSEHVTVVRTTDADVHTKLAITSFNIDIIVLRLLGTSIAASVPY
jgi:hypothetical protein